jgi:thiamine biosynthesis protein ThiS
MSTGSQHIHVVVNGERQQYPAHLTVADLLRSLEVAPVGVAVERNRSVVRRAEHETCVLQDGDAIEIVQFVGGG